MEDHTNSPDSSLPNEGRCLGPSTQACLRPKKKAVLFSSSSLQSAAAFSSLCSTALPSSADAGGLGISCASLLTTFRSHGRSSSLLPRAPSCAPLRPLPRTSAAPPLLRARRSSESRTKAEAASGRDQSLRNRSGCGSGHGSQTNAEQTKDLLQVPASEGECTSEAGARPTEQDVGTQGVRRGPENKDGPQAEAPASRSGDVDVLTGTGQRREDAFAVSGEDYLLPGLPGESGVAVLGGLKARYALVDAPPTPGKSGARLLPRSAAARLPRLGGRPAAVGWWVTDENTQHFLPVVRLDAFEESGPSRECLYAGDRDGDDPEPGQRGVEFLPATPSDPGDEHVSRRKGTNIERLDGTGKYQPAGGDASPSAAGAETCFSSEPTSSVTKMARRLLQAETLVVFRCSSASAVFLPSGWPCVYLRESQRLFPLAESALSEVSLGGDAETAAFLSRLSSEREGTIPRRLHGVLHREMESLLRLLDYNNLLDRTCSHSPVPDALLFSARPPSAPQSSGSAPACASARDVTRASSAMHGPAPSSPGPTSPRHRACCSSSSASPCCSAPLPLLLSCSGGALDVGGDQQAGQEQHREKPTRSSDPSRSPSPKQSFGWSCKLTDSVAVPDAPSVLLEGEEEGGTSPGEARRGDSPYTTRAQGSPPTRRHLPVHSTVEDAAPCASSRSVGSEFLFASSREVDEDASSFYELEHPGMSPEDLRRQEIVEGIHDMIERARYHGLIRRDRDFVTGEVHEYIIPGTRLDTQLNHITPFSGSFHKIGWEHLLSWHPPTPQTASEGEDDREELTLRKQGERHLKGRTLSELECESGDRGARAWEEEGRKSRAACKCREFPVLKDAGAPAANLRRQMYQDFLFVENTKESEV